MAWAIAWVKAVERKTVRDAIRQNKVEKFERDLSKRKQLQFGVTYRCLLAHEIGVDARFFETILVSVVLSATTPGFDLITSRSAHSSLET